MTPADRTRLRALATRAADSRTLNIRDLQLALEAHYREATPDNVLALLSALDAADALAKAARPGEDDGLIDTPRLYKALAAYDAATTAKEG